MWVDLGHFLFQSLEMFGWSRENVHGVNASSWQKIIIFTIVTTSWKRVCDVLTCGFEYYTFKLVDWTVYSEVLVVVWEVVRAVCSWWAFLCWVICLKKYCSNVFVTARIWIITEDTCIFQHRGGMQFNLKKDEWTF